MRSAVSLPAGTLGIILAMIFGAACGPSEEDVRALITTRLVAESLIAPEEEPLAGSDASATQPDDGLVAALESAEFLIGLERLMKSYSPKLPPVADKTDVLRCLTSASIESSERLKKARRSLLKARDASRKQRDRTERKFYEETYPLQFRVDLAWDERWSSDAVFGCWFNYQRRFRSDYARSKKECSELHFSEEGQEAEWRMRYAHEGARKYRYREIGLYRYSRTQVAEPPELMKRMETAGVGLPGRFACLVVDATVEDEELRLECAGFDGVGPNIMVAGTLPPNAGDVVSVAFAGVPHGPDGLLVGDLDRDGELSWTIDARQADLVVLTPAVCPTEDEILATVR